jgi:LmbE family N-acetylglucosaminyl deacetylase
MKWPAESNSQWREISWRLAPNRLDGSLRLAVLAAHPDDETLGASCWLAHLAEVRVFYLTDGAPRDSRFWSPLVQGSRPDYARIRRAEAEKALWHAGIPGPQIVFLGGVDLDVIFEACRLTLRLTELLSKANFDALLTHAYEGGHPDHDAASLIATMARSRLAVERRPYLLEMTSYHAREGRCVSGEFLGADRAPEICWELSAEDCNRKHKMLAEYGSQRLVLENFSVERERIRLAPEYDFSQPPHAGKLWYEVMGWPLEGARWRELALSALNEAEEQTCR